MDFWNGRDFSNWGKGDDGNRNGGQDANGRNEHNDARNSNGSYGIDETYSRQNGFGNYGNSDNSDANQSCSGGSCRCNRNGGGFQGNFDSFKQEAENSAGTNAFDKDAFEQKFNEYSGKSEDSLMEEMFKVASKMKNDGKFNMSELENFYNRSAAFLNDEQQARMRSLIDMLK